MPRGESKHVGTIRGNLALAPASPPPGAGGPGEACREIRGLIQAFSDAWYLGDEGAMRACLHPDHLNRLVTLGNDDSPMGVQGRLGAGIPAGERAASIRILDLRPASASAVAELRGWVLHLHLAKASGRWRVVNALWETSSLQAH
ncbi:MAG TPA: nuclear transport factor 2 family protein [Holophaga sp.]|nr:nuclear transport factor 2 family protein [Holophaga sp.]